MASCEMHMSGRFQVHDRLVRCLKLLARCTFPKIYSDAENVKNPIKCLICNQASCLFIINGLYCRMHSTSHSPDQSLVQACAGLAV